MSDPVAFSASSAATWEHGISAYTRPAAGFGARWAAEARVRLEVRGALAQLGAARRTEGTYRDELLPAERDLVRLTSQRYNGMLVGAYELISAKQGELAAERGEIRARRDCWAALAELEKSAGGSLNLANPSLSR